MWHVANLIQIHELKESQFFNSALLIESRDSHQCEQTNNLLLGHDTVNLEMVRQFSSGFEFESEDYQTHISKRKTARQMLLNI